jgi:hypothetical protein
MRKTLIKYLKKSLEFSTDEMNKIVTDKKELKHDLLKFFRNVYKRRYQLLNREKHLEYMKKYVYDKYHNDENHRKLKLKNITNNYIKKKAIKNSNYDFDLLLIV